jgi:3-isopropylmalate/(R)-2-methylmalate dehydratase large subunit
MYGGLGHLLVALPLPMRRFIMATGRILAPGPFNRENQCQGRLSQGVTAKDLALKILTLAPLHLLFTKQLRSAVNASRT